MTMVMGGSGINCYPFPSTCSANAPPCLHVSILSSPPRRGDSSNLQTRETGLEKGSSLPRTYKLWQGWNLKFGLWASVHQVDTVMSSSVSK